MFSLRTAILNISRRKSKSMLVILTGMVIVTFVFYYMNNIEINRKELLSLPQALPVSAQIENLSGTRIVGLEIQSEMVDQIAGSGYVKDLFYTARLAANFTSVPNETEKYKQISIMGANDAQALPGLKDGQTQFLDGYNLGFLHSQEAVCLADTNFLNQNNCSLGDTVDLVLYCLKANTDGTQFTFVPLGKASLRIVGEMDPAAMKDYGGINLLCPTSWVKAQDTQAGQDFTLDSAGFTVSDPLKLDAFKAAMKKLYLLPVNRMTQPSIKGCALSVKDETFIATAGRVKNTLSLLYFFAFVILFVIALIGYAVAYLLMQGRRADIAVMRSLGNSRKDCVQIMLLEYGTLGLAGCLLGVLCAAILIGLNASALWIAPLFLLSLMLGVLAAVLQISKLNTMTGLVKMES